MNNKLSTLEIGILSNYLIKSFLLLNGINILINISGNDSIISIIIGFIISMLFIKVIITNKASISSLNKMPLAISIIIKISLLTVLVFIISYLIYTISIFTRSSILNEINISYISIIFFLLILYTSNKGITTIVRSSFISFFILIILEIISTLLSLSNINSLNLLPFFSNGISNIIKSSLLYILLSTSPLFFLLCIDKDKLYTPNKKHKYIYVAFIGTSIYMLFNFTMVLSIINYRFANIIDYPETFILSKISILNFFNRMEVLLSFKFILDIFFTSTLVLYYINKLVNFIVKKELNIRAIKVLISLIIILMCNMYKFTTTSIITILIIFDVISIAIIFLSAYLNNQTAKKSP